VLANVKVLFGLVTMRRRRAGDGAAESMLVVTHLGATADRQGAAINRPGDASDHQGVATNCKVSLPAVKVPSPTARVPPATVRVPSPTRCVDRGDHRSRHMDLHTGPMVGANYHGL
jgi:hypothetical protein